MDSGKKRFNSYWLIYLVLALVIMLSSFFICIFEYQMIYDTYGLYFPFMHFGLLVLSLIVSVILKLIFQKKIRLLLLILLVIVVVFVSGALFSTALDHDGFMYPLIEYGGPLYFLRIGDYNLDGISEIGLHPLEELLTRKVTYKIPYSSENGVYIRQVDFDVTVLTKGDTVGSVYDDGRKNLIIFDFDEEVYKISSFSATVYLQEVLRDTYYPESIKFYTSNERGEKLNYISVDKITNTSFKLNLRDNYVKSGKDKIYIYYEMENLE